MEVKEPSPTQLGRYHIDRPLGAGGMGIVYLAHDTKLQRQVAIKKLRKDSTTPSAGARIQSEAQLLARLNHPNIVQLYDVLEEDGGIALVMEYIEGTTLKEWMREHSAPLRDKLNLLMQICQGLSEAHALGIIHRDLKPDNILITTNGTAKITDFGIAKSQHESPHQGAESITREDHVAGTVEAMSPEQLQGKPLDLRSDLFSLGAIAFQLLCGARPFEKCQGGTLALANRVINDPHTPPQQAWAGIPAPLVALLDRLLDKNPARRPESAQQVYEALALLHQHGSDTDTREFSETVTALLRKRPNRHRRIAAVMAGLVLLASGGYWGWKEITRLEPQYIAVMPVEIDGEVRGEENAKALTAAMVRQALTSAALQLKASALVSFEPKDGDDFDAQLKALHEKGITDALYARLDCARVRCEIELRRIGPAGNRVKQQTDFAFLADKRQEAEYRISNSTTTLFPDNYRQDSGEQVTMSNKDYSKYLNIVSRLESKNISEDDLNVLFAFSDSYPKNSTIYRTMVDVAVRIHATKGEAQLLEAALRKLDKAHEIGINKNIINSLQLLIYSIGDYQDRFELLASKLKGSDFPIAELKSRRARYFFRKGSYKEGLQEAEDAAALKPSADNLYLIAINHTASGNYTEARASLEKLSQAYPQHWSSHSLLGVIELESGNLASAEAAITAIPEELRSWRSKSNLAVAYFLQGKYTQSLATYQKVLKLTPENKTTIGQIADTYLMLGDKENARLNFELLLDLTKNKEDLESKKFNALAQANLGNISKAISSAHGLLREAPNDTYAKYIAAQVYALAEEWRSANYYIGQLLDQGMSAEWFNLPAFQKLCTQPQVSAKVTTAICD